MSSAPARSDQLSESGRTRRLDVKRRRVGESAIQILLLACASISVFTTISIVVVLVVESAQFFLEVSLAEFLTDTEWTPQFIPQHFGIMPLLCGTMLVAVGSALIAIPLGLGTAVYLSEYARYWFRAIVKPLLEVLAGIPSVVYGYIAIVLVSPIVRDSSGKLSEYLAAIGIEMEPAGVFNAANACVVVGVMILPTVISLSEDALRSVPQSLREGAYALGATKYETTVQVVVPAALSGIIASFLLAISRAIGETMAVTLAAGATPNLTLNPLESIQTMTAYIAQVSQGDTPYGTIEYRTIFAVGLTLFICTMIMNLLAQWIVLRMREKYE